MAVAPGELLRTARLARLALSDADLARLSEELAGILAHLEQLLAISVDVTAPAPLGAAPVPATRPDDPGADALVEPLAEIAPAWRSGYFLVPRVLGP